MASVRSVVFKPYRPLFGLPKDDRVLFFLDELYKQSINNMEARKPGNSVLETDDIKFTKVSDKFLNDLFSVVRPPTESAAVAEDWIVFIKEISLYMNSLIGVANQTASNNAIFDIKSDVLSVNTFMNLLKGKFFEATSLFKNYDGIIDAFKTLFGNSPLFSTSDGISVFDKLNSTKGAGAGADAVVDTNGTTIIAAGTLLLDSYKAKNAKGIISFKWNINAYFVKRALEEAENSVTPVDSDFDKAFGDRSTAPKYYRKRDGTLYTKKKNAKGEIVDVPLGWNSDEFKSLSIEKKCRGTGFVDGANDGEKCYDFLDQCLSGNGIEQCKQFLTSKDYWKNAKDEVDEMDPYMAYKILQKFEFKSKLYQATKVVRNKRINVELKEVICFSTWIECIKDKIDKGDLKLIINNNELKGYLELLIKKINDNPSILNPGYDITDIVANPYPRPWSRLAKMGLRESPHIEHHNRLNGIQTLIITNNRRLGRRISNTPTYALLRSNSAPLIGQNAALGTLPLLGGSLATNESYENRVNDESNYTATILANEYYALVQRLASRGKSVSDGDNKKILAYIESIKKSETHLYKYMLYTDKYIDLLETHGETDGDNVLSVNNLQQFVDKRKHYFDKTVNKHNTVLAILQAVQDGSVSIKPSDAVNATNVTSTPLGMIR